MSSSTFCHLLLSRVYLVLRLPRLAAFFLLETYFLFDYLSPRRCLFYDLVPTRLRHAIRLD